jgi:hypothetical protein
MLPFHYHRHRTHLRSFTAIFGMEVFQHCSGRQRARVSNVSFQVLDALCVSAGTTGKRRTPVVSADAVHCSYSVHDLFGQWRDWSNLKFMAPP